ncbi:putative flavoprotein involved in K+ transport [Catenuloplanes nepalensis]|uniref:Flavoprotein involved in K+ transport n=1 Tax=Catenuloplanes nepalensis TaxID=587533 RepID=A0ABT9MPV1_9ACTN|nr:NAD(P)-binding domain-containing protein [Catenuloplanes nepalensis]MDP9793448.1 putative flavoprotein involved in K+ transport [Catenuloplanes nepalensis]
MGTTVVVGAGAAGLATADRLRRHDPIVLDAGARIGDSWRHRYAGLRLFTPARWCALPGLPLPGDPDAHPGKDDYADYLESYADRQRIGVRLGTSVTAHAYRDGRHHLSTNHGDLVADRLVWASGAHAVPVVPPFADALDPAISQIHSVAFRDVIGAGPVLVVGAGQSGADIAARLAATRRTCLAGPRTGTVPLAVARSRAVRALYRLPVPGERARRFLRRRASPLIWHTARSLADAGVVRVPRVTGVRDGLPMLADGRVLPVATVVWCTGLRPRLDWLDPRAHGVPSLGFVGLPFQHTLSSGTLGGMSSDAARVARRLGLR